MEGGHRLQSRWRLRGLSTKSLIPTISTGLLSLEWRLSFLLITSYYNQRSKHQISIFTSRSAHATLSRCRVHGTQANMEVTDNLIRDTHPNIRPLETPCGAPNHSSECRPELKHKMSGRNAWLRDVTMNLLGLPPREGFTISAIAVSILCPS